MFLLNGVRRLLEILRTRSTQGFLKPLLDHGVRYWVESHSPEHRDADILHDLAARVDAATTDPQMRAVYSSIIVELRYHVSIALSQPGGRSGPVSRRPAKR